MAVTGVHAVVTASKEKQLEKLDFTLGVTLFSAEQLDEVLAELNAVKATIARSAGPHAQTTGVEQTRNVEQKCEPGNPVSNNYRSETIVITPQGRRLRLSNDRGALLGAPRSFPRWSASDVGD